jgi:hypothetical protein
MQSVADNLHVVKMGKKYISWKSLISILKQYEITKSKKNEQADAIKYTVSQYNMRMSDVDWTTVHSFRYVHCYSHTPTLRRYSSLHHHIVITVRQHVIIQQYYQSTQRTNTFILLINVFQNFYFGP